MTIQRIAIKHFLSIPACMLGSDWRFSSLKEQSAVIVYKNIWDIGKEFPAERKKNARLRQSYFNPVSHGAGFKWTIFPPYLYFCPHTGCIASFPGPTQLSITCSTENLGTGRERNGATGCICT